MIPRYFKKKGLDFKRRKEGPNSPIGEEVGRRRKRDSKEEQRNGEFTRRGSRQKSQVRIGVGEGGGGWGEDWKG